SPITSELYASAYVGLSEVQLEDGTAYWNELRPKEQGRYVVVQLQTDGTTHDITPPGFNARTRVHEYGGGSYLVDKGTVYFSNYSDQRLYRQKLGSSPEALTPLVDVRYADGVIDHQSNRIVSVREDHTVKGEAVNTIVSVDLASGGPGEVLVSGNNFYSSPRISPDGRQLAYLTWNHPNMPWDGTELWVSTFDADGKPVNSQRVAGGLKESVYQPEWSPDNRLYFVSDRTGWWNIYRSNNGRAEAICPLEAEFGGPQWVLRQSHYGFASPRQIICIYTMKGGTHLARLDTVTGRLEEILTPYSGGARQIRDIAVGPDHAVFVGGSPTEAESIVQTDLRTPKLTVLRRSRNVTVDNRYLSIPRHVEFQTTNGLTAHSFYYPAKNPDYSAPASEKPPLIAICHGGPTGQTSTALRYSIQYWTSRGIAVLDVDYRGSTGYGRPYRERLNGQWGVVDVDDCVNGARHLIQNGEVDRNRVAIEGGSAGGYTTMCALTFRDFFKAGASYFGISDLETFVKDTHKFESRYLDRLVGPYPEKKDLYRERSAINYVERVSCPMILFQGLEDKIVPPDQSEKFYKVLRDKGLPTAYIAYEGEQHGFRKSENIKRSIEAELYFYGKVFDFEPADQIESVHIDNIEATKRTPIMQEAR
ncbi:S9 family peptidase, partial [Candidatus Bathyarchaeota archaeon]